MPDVTRPVLPSPDELLDLYETAVEGVSRVDAEQRDVFLTKLLLLYVSRHPSRRQLEEFIDVALRDLPDGTGLQTRTPAAAGGTPTC